MAKKTYTVKEKEKHYSGIIAKADSVKKQSEKAHREDNRVSYAAGYNQAVKDCRAALKSK